MLVFKCVLIRFCNEIVPLHGILAKHLLYIEVTSLYRFLRKVMNLTRIVSSGCICRIFSDGRNRSSMSGFVVDVQGSISMFLKVNACTLYSEGVYDG